MIKIDDITYLKIIQVIKIDDITLCKAGCQRKQGVIIFRMTCSASEGADWCWNFFQPWKSGGLVHCNGSCQLIENVNKDLGESPLFTPAY